MFDISVAVPTYNSAKTLEATLFSLSQQKGCKVEVVVVDSGSTDNTLHICKKYSIPTLYIEPGNMYAAINAALNKSNSPWLSYLNSDDLVYPNSYARLISQADASKADIVYGSCDFIDEEGRFIHSYLPGYPNELFSQFKSSQLSFAQPASIFKKEVFKQLSGFDEEYKLASDLDFFLRSIFNSRKFAYLKGSPVCCFRVSLTQLSQQKELAKMENDSIRRKYGKPSMTDLWFTSIWRFRNWPNYLIRLFRYRTIKGKFTYVRTLDLSK